MASAADPGRPDRFIDHFDRADGPVGNGWSDFGADPATAGTDAVIVDQLLGWGTPASSSRIGIWRETAHSARSGVEIEVVVDPVYDRWARSSDRLCFGQYTGLLGVDPSDRELIGLWPAWDVSHWLGTRGPAGGGGFDPDDPPIFPPALLAGCHPGEGSLTGWFSHTHREPNRHPHGIRLWGANVATDLTATLRTPTVHRIRAIDGVADYWCNGIRVLGPTPLPEAVVDRTRHGLSAIQGYGDGWVPAVGLFSGCAIGPFDGDLEPVVAPHAAAWTHASSPGPASALTCTWPGGVDEGARVVVVVHADRGPGVTAPPGWATSPATADDRGGLQVLEHHCDGSEVPGAPFRLSVADATARLAAIALVVRRVNPAVWSLTSIDHRSIPSTTIAGAGVQPRGHDVGLLVAVAVPGIGRVSLPDPFVTVADVFAPGAGIRLVVGQRSISIPGGEPFQASTVGAWTAEQSTARPSSVAHVLVYPDVRV